MINCKENEEVEVTEEEYDYMNEEPLEEALDNDDEEPDYCD